MDWTQAFFLLAGAIIGVVIGQIVRLEIRIKRGAK
jgi:hypothetical protein